MKSWWLVIALLLSVGLNVGLFANRMLGQRSDRENLAEDSIEDPAPQDDRVPRVVYRMADELDLQGEKREAFVAVQRNFFEETLSARGRMARLQKEVRRQILSDAPDRQALDEVLTALSKAHGDLERAFVGNLLDTRDLLDADQERQYRRFLRRMRNVRSEVEKRFRDRWRSAEGRSAEPWYPGDARPRRFGPGRQREGRPPRPPHTEPPQSPQTEPPQTGPLPTDPPTRP